jgi:hypothetical protein
MVVWRDQCPQCGLLKDKRSELCQTCRRGAHISPRRGRRETDACVCGKTKHRRSRLCAACWREQTLKHPERLVPCPQCDELKDVRSTVCHKCHFTNIAATKDGKRYCNGCCVWLPEDEFGYSVNRAARRKSRCKNCECKKSKQYRLDHPEQVKHTKKTWNKVNPERTRLMSIRRTLRKIGVDESIIKQTAELVYNTHHCEICGKQADKKRLAIDHKHGTNTIRGILCSHCNNAIGLLNDDPAIVRRMAQYLEERS